MMLTHLPKRISKFKLYFSLKVFYGFKDLDQRNLFNFSYLSYTYVIVWHTFIIDNLTCLTF